MVTRLPQLPKLDPQTDAPVELVPVQYSLEYLERRMTEVFAAAGQLSDAASRIVTIDANETKNTLEVGVDGPITSTLRDRIARIAPDTPLELVSGPPFDSGSGESPALVSRVDDEPAWASGSFIYSEANAINGLPGHCTSGPGVKIGASKYMLTAAHCAANTGQLIRQGNANVAGTLQSVGTVANRSGYPNLDAMLVNGTTGPTMFRSWYGVVAVSSLPWESLTGQSVCTGGAFSGERCNIKVYGTNFCDTRPGWNNCGLTLAIREDGANAAGQGDSGGPVYILAPGTRYSGIVTAGQDSAYGFPCPNYPAGQLPRRCYSRIYFTRIQNTLGYFGASLL
ncbi:hypothetical protein [Kribbella soli]|uniref:Peptidase S1 domain-containing protein n=1 Tax=Kribbella soli TaxID=1124743 RepID=A0A4R0HBY1_9ACTN|nr:hypothetical protein [Kribbella soli]TCC08517.1 hypothetical protein E0H45_21840 [Kribbella soli]